MVESPVVPLVKKNCWDKNLPPLVMNGYAAHQSGD